MILSEIKRYVQERQTVTLDDLSAHFQTDREAMREMIEHWIRKGAVKKNMGAACCKRCTHCETPHLEIYEWTTA